jgi:ubiquinone/menaquinone biosynthesis C-methylase UbiE
VSRIAEGGRVTPWDETLYAGAAPYYVAGRRPYPPQLGEAIARELGLRGDERAVDVGCGPGGFTVVLAPHVGRVVGVDPDEGMLTEAAAVVARAGLQNVELRRMTAEQLPADLGPVALVTFAQSFHWVDRERAPGIVRDMLTPGGHCVVVHASTARGDESDDALPRPRPPYEEIHALVARYLGPLPRAGRSVRSEAFTPPHITDAYFRAAGFDGPRDVDIPRGEIVTRTVDQVVAATFSLSSSTPALLGERRAEFERDLRALLESASDDGHFDERARDLRFEVWTPGSQVSG